MIYLQNTTDSQVVFVPKSGAVPNGELLFIAKSTIDLDVKVEQPVIDLNTSALYFNLAVSLPDNIPNGEYEYTLKVGDILLSSGVLVIGENFRPSEYNKEISYEQYETE